jgi:hypothetical protein
MKFKIQAGGELDILTQKEMHDELKGAMSSWITEVSRGDRYRRFAIFGDSSAGTAVTIGDTAVQSVGPAEGFVWSIKRLALSSGFDPATHTLALFINSPDNSALVHPDLSAYNAFDENQLVLYPGDRLLVTGTATASTRIWLTGQARELPISLAWRL